MQRLPRRWPCSIVRRGGKPIAYPWAQALVGGQRERPADGRGASDYAANGGDTYTEPGGAESTVVGVDRRKQRGRPCVLADGGVDGSLQQVAEARGTFANIAAAATGVIYTGSLSQAGRHHRRHQQHLPLGREDTSIPKLMITGKNAADNEAALMGDNGDVSRWTGADNGDTVVWLPPLPDTPGYWTVV